MATLTMNPPTRQPLGAVGGARLRNLGCVKNTQNAIPGSQPSKLKTFSPQPHIFDDIDSENIDPSIFKSSNKTSGYPSKNFTSNTNNMNCFKPAQFVLTRATAARASATQLPPLTQAIGLKRKAESAPSASEIEPQRPSKSPRKFFPPPPSAPAGRSPKSKRIGILSRHRNSASPFTRVDPPTFGANKSGSGLPFSIDAALAGTIPSHKLRKPAAATQPIAETVVDVMPTGKDRMFEIYTDNKVEEDDNLMTHSTCTLDISDDENTASKMFDEENKENIPPHPGMNVPASHAVIHASRKHMMTDEPRAPLGDLEASDYYADGCDATSYITIPADDDVKPNTQNEIVAEASTVYTSAKVDVGTMDKTFTWNDLIEMAKPTDNTTGLTPAMTVMTTNTAVEQGSLHPILEDNEDGSATGSAL